MKAIIFDFDGVIHDTFEFHRNKIKNFTKIDFSKQSFRDMHNGNFFYSIPNEIKNVNWEKYRDFIYDDFSKLKIKKEIKEIILKLSKKYELYIISSGGTKNIFDYFENNKIISVFKEILGLETFKSKIDKFNFIFDKYNLTAVDCIFVTDTLGDILEANKVNIKTIAVDFGFHNKETLEKGNPYKIISDLNELFDIVTMLNSNT